MVIEKNRRVGVIGHGAVGSVLARMITEKAGTLVLAGVFALSPVPDEIRVDSFDDLLTRSDLVVEAASQDAVASYGPAVVKAGRDLVVVSVGALRDQALVAALSAGPGRLLVTTGAIGGVDQLRAASMLGRFDKISLTTRKPARALVRPWMTAEMIDALEHGTEAVVVFEGFARAAVELFPESVNVAATLSLVTVGFDEVTVRMVADPSADRVEHIVRAAGPAGSYEFRFDNVPSPDNVRTSAITPYSVLRGLIDLDAPVVFGF